MWEIRIKQASGKLQPPDSFFRAIQDPSLELLPISAAHAEAAAALPLIHRDLFDRMLVAQARLEGLTLVTADGKLAAYDVPVLDAKRKRKRRR